MPETETLTLVEFLEARIAEDEQQALASKASSVTLGIPPAWLAGVADRVLAECAAKRKIIEEHRTWGEVHRDDEYSWPPVYPEAIGQCVTCGYGDEWQARDFDPSEYPCPTLRAVASVYSGHHEFRDEWR